MANNGSEKYLYHFSRSIFFLSVIFLLINAILYGISLGKKQEEGTAGEVSPKISFEKGDKVFLTSLFSAKTAEAKPGQNLFTGMSLWTDEKSAADLTLEKNSIRLNSNTKIRLKENHFQDAAFPRLVFELLSGSVWVNARDPLLFIVPKSDIRLADAMGFISYEPPVNKVMMLSGSADISLKNEKGEKLSGFILPLKNQILYADSQITPEYARLQYSKLKKELKMSAVPSEVYETEWVKQNAKIEFDRFKSENHFIYSSSQYEFLKKYYEWSSLIAFFSSQKQSLRFHQIDLKMRYLLGAVHSAKEAESADRLIEELQGLLDEAPDDPVILESALKRFNSIRGIKTDTPAYRLKEFLREYLFGLQKNPEIFRSYLTDLDFILRLEDLTQANTLAKNWLAEWKPGIRKQYFPEFEQECRIYQNILMSYSALVTPELLKILDETGDYRIENAASPEETLLEVAQERLEIAKQMVASARYDSAKNYLQTSYLNLKLDQKEINSAARNLFIKEGASLADRIAFASRNPSGKIDENAFREYLAQIERDKTLSERFQALMEEKKVPEIAIAAPEISEVSRIFARSRIAVLDEDIVPDARNPFEFEIRQARLVDRGSDGSLVIFSGRFDFSSKGIFEIKIDDQSVKGSFTLDDFVRYALKKGIAEKPVEPPKSEENLSGLLRPEKNEETLRAQLVAQDLAIQLAMDELRKFGIDVPGVQQISLLNTVTLKDFRVESALISDSADEKQLKINFDYYASDKTVSRVSAEGSETILIAPRIKAERLRTALFGVLSQKENEINAFKGILSEIRQENLTVKETDIEFTDSAFGTAKIKKIRLAVMPIEFSGTYERKTRQFLIAEHALLKSENRSPGEYAKELAKLWVIDYLKNKSIEITAENLKTELPAEKIEIKNYKKGENIFDFIFDVTNNRLADVSLQGSEAKADFLSFEEFELVQKQ